MRNGAGKDEVMTRYHFIIADDHPLFREALRHAVSAAYEGVQIEEAGSLEEVVLLLDAGDAVDLLLLDLKMPGVQGLAGLAYLRAQFPDVPTVVISATEDLPVIRRAIALGASGFIPKSTPVSAIRQAVGEVLAGNVWLPPDAVGATADESDAVARRLATLTPQQVRVLMMLREGLLNKQIAFALGVSEATVKAHVSAVLQKLGVESRTQAVIAVGRIDDERGQADIAG